MFVNQAIQRPAGINVFGSFTVRTDPDYASLRFSVGKLEPNARDAFGKVRDASRDVRVFLATSGIADASIQTSHVSLAQLYEGYGEKRTFLGYQTQIGFTVLVDPVDRVEDILVGVIDAGVTSIERVTFETRRLRELRAESRVGAIAAARRKAEIYAHAAGVGVGNVRHIEDVDPTQTPSRRSHETPDADRIADDDESPAGRSVGSIVIAAAVMVCFEIVPPRTARDSETRL